jgi:hypothetical protein
MLVLESGPDAPAQVLFDLGALRGSTEPAADGVLAAVISGASAWVAKGLDTSTDLTLAQVRHALGLDLVALRTVAEKRATFLCTPGLERPPATIAPGLIAAGDYVAGPYPATLEGSVRSGIAAARH